MSESMVIIAGHYRVDADRRDELVEAHRDLVMRARASDGCLDLAVTGDPEDPERVNMFEIWRDADVLEEWRGRSDPPELDIEMRDMQVLRYDAQDGGPLF